jgi:hypothetical protein
LVPSCINEYEEYNENKKNRDYTYDPSFKNTPLAELVFQKTVQSWKYIVATTESTNALEPAVLDFLDKRFKNRINILVNHHRNDVIDFLCKKLYSIKKLDFKNSVLGN